MSTIGKRTIFVGPADGPNHKPLHVEGLKTGAGVVAPGTVVRYTVGTLTQNVIAAAVDSQFFVADRNFLLQKDVDTVWPLENMVAIQPRTGEFLNVRVVTGQALVIGTPLTRDGAGSLRIALTDGTEQIHAYSEEAVTTATAAPGELVLVRIP